MWFFRDNSIVDRSKHLLYPTICDLRIGNKQSSGPLPSIMAWSVPWRLDSREQELWHGGFVLGHDASRSTWLALCHQQNSHNFRRYRTYSVTSCDAQMWLRYITIRDTMTSDIHSQVKPSMDRLRSRWSNNSRYCTILSAYVIGVLVRWSTIGGNVGNLRRSNSSIAISIFNVIRCHILCHINPKRRLDEATAGQLGDRRHDNRAVSSSEC